jgi:diadenosine tetraphosphate (Ap4A) HIT family hydrolase
MNEISSNKQWAFCEIGLSDDHSRVIAANTTALAVYDAYPVTDGHSQPDSFNIVINEGPSAGQTIPHVHMHLIPRYGSETDDLRGGVRWIIANKANHWD